MKSRLLTRKGVNGALGLEERNGRAGGIDEARMNNARQGVRTVIAHDLKEGSSSPYREQSLFGTLGGSCEAGGKIATSFRLCFVETARETEAPERKSFASRVKDQACGSPGT